MNKRFTFIILGFIVLVLLFVIFPLIIFKFGLGKLVYALFSQQNDIIAKKLLFNIVGLTSIVILSVVFGLAGYKLAKRKQLNVYFWTAICIFFNFWGYILLRIISKKMIDKRL